jgi:hypothetical protein
MNENEIQTMLGLAFLENHPRLEVMQNLVRIASKLENLEWQKVIFNCAERIYLPSTTRIKPPISDEVLAVLLEFTEHCTNQMFTKMETQNLREILAQIEKLLNALENTWRKNQISSAKAAANTALDWMIESIIGRGLSTAELAVMRGIYLRRQHLRSKN